MSKYSDLDIRMRIYEDAYNFKLVHRMPIIIRIDGKGFHNWTKKMEKPFSAQLYDWLGEVAINICEEIQGAELAYHQSDEISFLIKNYTNFYSQPAFNNRLQKLCSITAAIASSKLTLLSGRIAQFDSRVFVLPREEVTNYFFGRQTDASRNSVQMLARSLASHKECHNLNGAQLQELCFQRGKNWNDLPTHYKRGQCIVKRNLAPEHSDLNPPWRIDREIPIFKESGRSYINNHLQSNDNE